MTRSFGLAAFGLLAWVFPAFATPSFSVTPSGTVSGQPGDTVGWGYSITNDTADVLLVSNTYFCQSGQDPLLTTCTQQLGAYNDFAASNTTEVAPSGAANQSFDATTFSGIGDYVISSLATPGQSDVGFLVLVYDLYTCDPLTDCGATRIGGDVEMSAAAEVDVTGAPGVPEPGTWILVSSALAILVPLRRFRRGRATLRTQA